MQTRLLVASSWVWLWQKLNFDLTVLGCCVTMWKGGDGSIMAGSDVQISSRSLAVIKVGGEISCCWHAVIWDALKIISTTATAPPTCHWPQVTLSIHTLPSLDRVASSVLVCCQNTWRLAVRWLRGNKQCYRMKNTQHKTTFQTNCLFKNTFTIKKQ